MHPNANNFRIRQCVVCGFNFSDEHHINAEILGKDKSPTIILCPNHHRLAHILQCRLSSKQLSIQYTIDFVDSFFDIEFIDKAMPILIREYDRLTRLSELLGDVLPYFRGDFKEKLSKVAFDDLEVHENSLPELEPESSVKELKKNLEIYNNYRLKLEEAIEIHNNYLPKLETIVEKLELDASKESINCNLKSEETLRLEEETYSKFCRVIGWKENGYSRIIWNKLVDKSIELNKKGCDAKAFTEHFIHVAKKLSVTKSLTD
jgi:hypothetical protein